MTRPKHAHAIGTRREVDTFLRFRPREVYTTEEVGLLFSVSPAWIRKIMDSGEIPHWCIPDSKYRRLNHKTLVAWLRANPEYHFFLERLEWAVKLMARMNGAANG